MFLGNARADLHQPPGRRWRAASRRRAAIAPEPEGNSTSDWKTKRSPTICTSTLAGQGLAQLAEEFRAVARQFLDLAGERPIELLAEIDDLGVLFLGLGVGGVQRCIEGAPARP